METKNRDVFMDIIHKNMLAQGQEAPGTFFIESMNCVLHCVGDEIRIHFQTCDHDWQDGNEEMGGDVDKKYCDKCIVSIKK